MAIWLQNNGRLVILIKLPGVIFIGCVRNLDFPKILNWWFLSDTFHYSSVSVFICICSVLVIFLPASCLLELCTKEFLHFLYPGFLTFPCLCLLGEGIDHHVSLSIRMFHYESMQMCDQTGGSISGSWTWKWCFHATYPLEMKKELYYLKLSYNTISVKIFTSLT